VKTTVQGEAVLNKVALALLALAASMVVSACGGTQGSGLADLTQQTTPMTARGKPKPTDPKKSCDAQGVNSTQLRTGACTEDGIQYVVGNYEDAVRLRTLGVAIIGVSVSGVAAGHGRRAAPTRDAFLRITLQVQNRDKVPHRFDFGQTMLGIGADNYTESTAVERRVHPESLASVNGGKIGPGETLRGDVLFDITQADYEVLDRQGRFFIWNFGDHAAAQIAPRSTKQLGQIRLYAHTTTS
jgi:hypothetical protein